MKKHSKSAIYLDYAAASPMDDRVLAAMQPYFSANFYNPSATYLAASDAKKDLDEARGLVAHWLGARPSEIIFTAGGTEANNIAINGVMKSYPESNLIISAIEHDSVRGVAHQANCKEAKVNEDGRINIQDLTSKIDDNTVLISIMHANNEIGTIQPIKEISEIVSKISRQRLKDGNTIPLLLHVDSCQAANYLDLHVARLGVDLLSINGGKIYGPKQIGALYVKGGVKLSPTLFGGGQEQGLRSGTQNVPAAIGLAKALDITQKMKNQEVPRLQKLQKLFIDLIAEKIPNAVINGSIKTRLPNNVHLTIENTDNETVLIKLDEAGVQAAAGSACSASSDEPSHVLKAIGLSTQQIQSSLRFTMGRNTTEKDVQDAVAKLSQIVNQ